VNSSITQALTGSDLLVDTAAQNSWRNMRW
jgi:hypothetical protein